jgi:plastocyanin
MHRTSRLGLTVAGLTLTLFACSGSDGGVVDNASTDSDAAAAEIDSGSGSTPAPTDNGPSGPADPEDAGAPTRDTDAGDHVDAGAGEGGHGGGAAGDGGAGDGGAALNGCTPAKLAAHDESAINGNRTILFAGGATPQPYAPSCMRIAKGQGVTWRGPFAQYPLEALGGATPSPIVTTNAGNKVTIIFPAPGTYGFASSAAPKVMLGAIDVK